MGTKCWGQFKDTVKDTERTDLNRPEPNEELVLQEYGEDEKYNAFGCHGKQVLPYEVPLKRVKSWFCACGEEPHTRYTKKVLMSLRIIIMICCLTTLNNSFIQSQEVKSQLGCVLIGKRTESLEGVCHGLVFSHVNESSTQAEMREDEKHFLQDPVYLVQMLERQERK